MKKLFDKEAAKRFWNNIKKLFVRKPQNEGAAGKYLKYVSENATEWADFPTFLNYKGTKPDQASLKNIEDPVKGDVYTVLDSNAEFFYNGANWEYIGDVIGGSVSGEYVKKTGDMMTGVLTTDYGFTDSKENTFTLNKGFKLSTGNDEGSAPWATLNTDGTFFTEDGLGNKVIELVAAQPWLHFYPTTIGKPAIKFYNNQRKSHTFLELFGNDKQGGEINLYNNKGEKQIIISGNAAGSGIEVPNDPIADMEVATKRYVDTVKDYAISLNGQSAEITKKNTIIDEYRNSIEFYSGYNSTLLEDFTAANISQIAKGMTAVTGTNWWGFSRTNPVGTTIYYPLIYFDKVSVKLIFNITITKTTTNKSATYPVCILADTPPTHTAVILSELPKGLDFTLSKKPDKPSGTTQLLSLKVDSSFLSGCDVKIQLKQYSFTNGDKLGLKMVTNFEISDNIPSYSNMTTNKNWIDYMEETAQIEAKSHPSIIGTEVPWQSLEEAVAQSAINQIQDATKGNIALNYSPDILLNIDNITFEVGDHIPDTSYLYYTLKNFTNKLALS